jgi:hypothetical protein
VTHAGKPKKHRRLGTRTWGGQMFSRRLSILRLRRYERECRTGSLAAADPLTKRELSLLAQTFDRYAMELEATESQLAEG